VTTGNVVYGNRFLDRLGTFAGSWTEKTWTGGDRPPAARRISLSGMTREEKRLYFYTARRVRRAAPFEPHAYSCTITNRTNPLITYVNVPGKWEVSNPHGSQGAFGLPSFPPDPWTDNHHLSLIANLRDKVVGGGFNLSVTIAEMGQTAQFIGDVARRINRLDKVWKRAVRKRYSRGPGSVKLLPSGLIINSGKRSIRISAPEIIGTLRDDWLAYQYAVKPLLGDIRNACETLANINNRKKTTRFSAHLREVVSAPGNSNDFWNGGTSTVTSGERIVAYISDGPNILLEASGILNPEVVLWEKIPFSFVADWFLPVGDFLKAVSFWRNWEGQFVVTRKVHKVNPSYGGSGSVYTVSGGTQSYSQLSLTRTVQSQLVIPYPKLQGLGQANHDLRHAISGVALLLSGGQTREYVRN